MMEGAADGQCGFRLGKGIRDQTPNVKNIHYKQE